MVNRVRAGEAVDIVVALPELIDSLIKDGRIIGETRTNLVRSGLGVEVRAGAPKPDVTSVEAFKQTLLQAKSVGYLNTPAGTHLDAVLDRLGIAEAMKQKTTRPNTDTVSELVAQGKLELGIVVTTQILTTPGVELVGRLPAEIQYFVSFVGGVTTASGVPDAAQGLLKFLTSPVAVPVIESQGMEPS